jgi:hypothetical protein
MYSAGSPTFLETARNFTAYSGLRSVGRRPLSKVVAEGGDDVSAGQLREHGLWLVSLDARFRIEAIQLRRVSDIPIFNTTTD